VQVAHGFGAEAALDDRGGLDNNVVVSDELFLDAECAEGSPGRLVVLVAVREQRDECRAID
jgi:hypothetical protein